MNIFKKITKEEREQLDNFFYRSNYVLKNWMLLALVLYASFGLIDYYMLQEHYLTVLKIRFGVVVPILILILFSIYYFKQVTHIKAVLIIYVLAGTFGILIFLSFANPEDTAYKLYFVGLLMVCLWAQLITFPSYLSTYIVLTVHLLYVLTAIFVMDMLPYHTGLFIGSNLFFLSSDVLGFYASRALSHFILSDTQKTLELEKMNESRTKLITILSHDIRGPLTNINSLLKLYENDLINREELLLYNKKLGESVNSVENILCSILNWSNTLLKENQFDYSVLYLKQLVTVAFEQYKQTADKKNVRLINRVPASFKIQTDENVLLLVIRNLISNAIKFTENGTVSVSCEMDESDTIIKIMDTGVGMTREQMDRINGHGQINSSLGTHNEKGMGLGLWMCKDFLKKIDGDIKATSSYLEGTTFIVRIPIHIPENRFKYVLN